MAYGKVREVAVAGAAACTPWEFALDPIDVEREACLVDGSTFLDPASVVYEVYEPIEVEGPHRDRQDWLPMTAHR